MLSPSWSSGAVHHIQQERQHHFSYSSELCDCVERRQRPTVARERDADASFLEGSNKVESLFCYLPKRLGCLFVVFLFESSAHLLKKPQVVPKRCCNSPKSVPIAG